MKQKTPPWAVITAIVIGVLLIVGVVAMLNKEAPVASADATSSAVSLNNDQQTIRLNVHGGYSPKTVEAKAGVATTLIMKTQNTFDCSSAVVIPKLNLRQNLPTTGETSFAIPPQAPGTEIRGTCSMGMYFFTIKFV